MLIFNVADLIELAIVMIILLILTIAYLISIFKDWLNHKRKQKQSLCKGKNKTNVK